jgi:hypothetical protein
MTWSRHLKILLGTFGGVVIGLVAFVLAMNPFGNLPNSVLSQHVMMDDNQRYQYPSVVRSGRYDSLIIGTSTSRLIDPAPFETAFGGRFANVALNSGTAWEQTELVKLFLRHQKKPQALVVGIDWVWCAQNADRERITFRGFPEWMYDDNRWNDLAYILNTRAVEISGRRLAAAVGGVPARLPPNGWEIFTPPEADYDLAKVLLKIYGAGPRQLPTPKEPADVLSAAERAELRFPALAWLESLVRDGGWRRVVLMLPPVHVMAQPRDGTLAALVEAECKTRIARIGAEYRIPVVDFRFRSDITTRDEHYWDPLHYRVAIAKRIASGVVEAVSTGRDAPDGTWRLLARRD